MSDQDKRKLLLEVENLGVRLPTGRNRFVDAVQSVSLKVYENERVGIVGESGSGKSVTVRAINGLLPQSPLVSTQGSIKYKGTEILDASARKWRELQAKEISMIFQDPLSFLNPTATIGSQVYEAMRQGNSKARTKRDVFKYLELAGLTGDLEVLYRSYPFELSGGMRQRVLIAIAFSKAPEIIIADEPTTALDVTVQRHVLQSLNNSVQETKKSLLLITHDLGVVAAMCDRVYVMYAGMILEEGSVDEIFYNPQHDYTKELLKSVQSFSSDDQELYVSNYS